MAARSAGLAGSDRRLRHRPHAAGPDGAARVGGEAAGQVPEIALQGWERGRAGGQAGEAAAQQARPVAQAEEEGFLQHVGGVGPAGVVVTPAQPPVEIGSGVVVDPGDGIGIAGGQARGDLMGLRIVAASLLAHGESVAEEHRERKLNSCRLPAGRRPGATAAVGYSLGLRSQHGGA